MYRGRAKTIDVQSLTFPQSYHAPGEPRSSIWRIMSPTDDRMVVDIVPSVTAQIGEYSTVYTLALVSV